MITIHPFGLATLIDNREPLDLIDVRTQEEFNSFHIAGARSVPLKKLSAPRVLRDRKSAATKPLYIMGEGRVRASAVVLSGGMDAWISQGLSVVRKKRFWNFPQTLLKQCRCDADAGGVSLIADRRCAKERLTFGARLKGILVVHRDAPNFAPIMTGTVLVHKPKRQNAAIYTCDGT